VSSAEDTLRAAYAAFNARDIEGALELMHPEVDWPNAWEGGRVVGRQAVADYWTRQFEAISSTVEADTQAHHRYRLQDGLIVRMDVLDAAA
jgi:ketosteroid isomerase-like protein